MYESSLLFHHHPIINDDVMTILLRPEPSNDNESFTSLVLETVAGAAPKVPSFIFLTWCQTPFRAFRPAEARAEYPASYVPVCWR